MINRRNFKIVKNDFNTFILTRENSEYQTPFVLETSCDIKKRLNFNQLIRSLDLNQNG